MLTYLLAAALCLIAVPALGDIVSQRVAYDLPTGETAQGVLVYEDEDEDEDEDESTSQTSPRAPDASGAAKGRSTRPAVLVIPEWWGLTDYPQTRARELAGMGYVAFVADTYGQGKTTDDPNQAGQWAGQAKRTGLAKLAAPALEQLAQQAHVDPNRIGAVGFCFGGSTVVAMANAGLDVRAVVSFHGGLGPDAAPNPEAGDQARTPMLILHGGADPMVPPDQFARFVENAIRAGVPLSVVSFPGAKHAFSNPDATKMAEKTGMDAIGYDREAAEQGWQAMRDFFKLTINPSPASGEQ